MATLRIAIKGTLGQISASSFATIIEQSLRVLRALDRRMSEERRGTLQWVISGLGEGSAYVDLATRIARGEEDFSSKVHNGFMTGIEQIKSEGTTPAYFSQDNMAAVRTIVRQFGRDGVEGVNYKLPESAPVELTQETEPNLDKLVGVHYTAIGSVEGVIELVSVRRGSRRFSVTHAQTLRAIRCNLPEELEESVLEAIKKRGRVVVTGLIDYNARNEQIRVHVQKPLRFLGEMAELPTTSELGGSDRELTGSMSTEEYVRSLRDG